MKVAIITGAGSGIGFATAAILAKRGMAIIGTGRDADKLRRLTDVVDANRLATVPIDVTLDDAPHKIVDAAVERWDKVDLLINNAGMGRPKPVEETDDALLDACLSLMLRAPFRMIRESLPHMSPGSAIINVSSTFAIVGGMTGGAYSAAKAGITGLTTHVAAAYGPRGIRCNVVAPGVVPTPMTDGRYDDPAFIKMNNHMTPYTRLGTVDDVVGTIAFLASPDGEFINGQVIVVDGGWSTTKYLSEFGLNSDWVEPRNRQG